MSTPINQEDKEKTNSHFMNLFSLAIADSEVSVQELELLYSIGIENGITKEDVDYLIDNPHKVRYSKPSTIDDTIEQLYHFCQMILADKRVDVREVAFVKSIMKSFNIGDNQSENILDILIDGMLQGETKSILITKVGQILNNG